MGLTAASSAIDAGVQKKVYGSGTTTLVISNEEMNGIMKIIRKLRIVVNFTEFRYFIESVTKTIKNEIKEQKGGFICMLLGTLGASLLSDLLTKILSGKGTVRAGERFLRAGEGINKKRINAREFFSEKFTTSSYKF